MRFRPDIEGLRAIAILPIVALHSGVGRLQGGFLGVDIFFVVSGYLITRILMDSHFETVSSLGGFYRRRAARILPALTAMILITLVAGLVLLLPTDAAELGLTAAIASVFAANFYFADAIDYFSANNTNLLLHLWSLGVEEQFYLIYPLFIVMVRRHFPTTIGRYLAALALLSLTCSIFLFESFPRGAFYLLPSRAWELALGGLVAVVAMPAITSAMNRSALSVLALATIVVSVLLVESTQALPVPWAIPVCIGTAALLAYGETGPTGRLLSLAPLRWIGRISFSLYLWHWPIIALYKIETGTGLSHSEQLGLIAVSTAAGAVSYYMIERPFLRRRISLRSAGLIIVLTAGAGLVAMALAPRLAPDTSADRIATYINLPPAKLEYQFDRGRCLKRDQFDYERCFRLVSDKRNIVLVGDSYAAQHLRTVIDHTPGANIVQATVAGCLPLLGENGNPDCVQSVSGIYQAILSDSRVSKVILSASWNAVAPSKIGPTIRALRAKGIAVTILGASAEYYGSFPRILATSIRRGDLSRVEAFRVQEGAAIDRAMQKASEAAGAEYYSLYQRECSGNRCRLFASNDVPMHFDSGHLTLEGSRELLSGLPLQ
jgi:peptidoglycan/LPS O-acetylase OafA/YrhL